MTALIRADVVKLIRRRGLVAWSSVLTVGLVVLFYVWRTLQGLDPVGGADQLSNLMEGLATVGAVAAIMVGCTAGAGDASAGILRDLVATGRPRLQLFISRSPAVLIVVVPLALVTALIAGLGAALFAGSGAAPGLGVVLQDAAWLACVFAVLGVLACGVSTLLGSQAIAIGVLLGWHIAASNLLMSASSLGNVRWAIPLAAMDRLQPAAQHFFADMPIGVASLVLVAWAAAAIAVGAWRMARADV
jgi:ABC-type transport system involved in multi-copper enzyme maturation permease subunit